MISKKGKKSKYTKNNNNNFRQYILSLKMILINYKKALHQKQGTLKIHDELELQKTLRGEE